MRQLKPVIWSKGTFLSPQHLQSQERFVEDTLHFYLDSLVSKLWGFQHIQIDQRALAEGTLTTSVATGIFPDALSLDVPASDAPPASRVLEECFRDGRGSCMFYLAIPQYLQGGMNVSLARGRVSTRYFAQLQMLRDENSGGSEKPVQVARKNIQLLAEGENLEGSVLLPCARVLRTETGLYELDPTYVPPLLDAHGSEILLGIVRRLVELLVTRSSQLSGGRRQKNQTLADFTASDVANFWLLYTLNTHLPALRHYLESSSVPPETLFSSLSELAGTLTAFSTSIDPRDLPRYDHEQLGPTFLELERLLRQMLETVVPSNFVAIPLNLLRDTLYAAAIDKDAWFENSRFYLAVAADMRDADIIDRIPKLTKACSATHIETLIRQALPGIRMTHVETPPRAIPVKLRYQYFSLERSGPAWEAVERARNFAVYAPSDLRNPQMELVILLPKAS